jgi:hypothetical protein
MLELLEFVVAIFGIIANWDDPDKNTRIAARIGCVIFVVVVIGIILLAIYSAWS